jgi:hypothetical protein
MVDRRDLKLCGMLHCHLKVCILSEQEDPIILLWVMVDQKACIYFSLSIAEWRLEIEHHVIFIWRCYIVGIRGSNHELWWIQEGWRVWNSLCSFLFLDGQLEILETLLNNLLSFADVHIARMGGSNFFFWIVVDPYTWRVRNIWCPLLLLDDFVQFFIVICRCANCFERRIQFLVWWIQKGWRMLNKLWMFILLLMLSLPVLLVHWW